MAWDQTARIVAAGLVAAGAAWCLVGHVDQRVRREEQLVYAADEIRDAIASYYYGTPGRRREFPREFAELLNDERGGDDKHHLARLLEDPMTGAADWVAIRDREGRIVGVHSASNAKPSTGSSGSHGRRVFAHATRYSEVLFLADAGEFATASGSSPGRGSPETTGLPGAGVTALPGKTPASMAGGGGHAHPRTEIRPSGYDRRQSQVRAALLSMAPRVERAIASPWAIPGAMHVHRPGEDWTSSAMFLRFCAAHREFPATVHAVRVSSANGSTEAAMHVPHVPLRMSAADFPPGDRRIGGDHAPIGPRPGQGPAAAQFLAWGAPRPDVPTSWIIPSRQRTATAAGSAERLPATLSSGVERVRTESPVAGSNGPVGGADAAGTTIPEGRIRPTGLALGQADERAPVMAGPIIEPMVDGGVRIAYSGPIADAARERSGPAPEAAVRADAPSRGPATEGAAADARPVSEAAVVTVPRGAEAMTGGEATGACGTLGIRDIRLCAELLREGKAPAYARCLASARERAMSCASGGPVSALLVSADEGAAVQSSTQ
jgi:hypothetical protein